jgi:phytol kinase
MNQLFSFFIDNFPSLKEILIGGPPGLAFACACLYLAGYLKKYRGLNTGYTRKIFHFLIFTSAAVIHFMWGLPGVFIFGAMTSLVIFYALLRGDGHLLYEAMAREKDAPHRTYYIIAPYLATLVGGLAGNFWFAKAAIIGYLVTGIGDAVAEPVGVRWGKHQYRVPSLSHVKSLRSLEGSAAVFFASALMILLGIALSPHFNLNIVAVWKIPLLALLCAGVEAVSPHGWDNATMQIIPAFLATILL